MINQTSGSLEFQMFENINQNMNYTMTINITNLLQISELFFFDFTVSEINKAALITISDTTPTYQEGY